MEVNLSNRKLKKYLNAYLSKKEGQRIRVSLSNNPTDLNYLGSVTNRPNYIRADYYSKGLIDGSKVCFLKHLYEEDIRNILQELFYEYHLDFIRTVESSLSHNLAGVQLRLSERQMHEEKGQERKLTQKGDRK